MKRLILTLFLALISLISIVCTAQCCHTAQEDYTSHKSFSPTLNDYITYDQTFGIISKELGGRNRNNLKRQAKNPSLTKIFNNDDELAQFKYAPSFIRNRIKYAVLGPEVTIIPVYAFSGCKSLQRICIPNNVETINSYAFYNCESLDDIIIPDSVNWIGNHCFYNCYFLNKIKFSKNLKFIGNDCFSNCISLKNIDLPESLVYIGEHAFCNCSFSYITIPSKITHIEVGTFEACPNLKALILPENITTIKEDLLSPLACDILIKCNGNYKDTKTYKSIRKLINSTLNTEGINVDGQKIVNTFLLLRACEF